MSLNRDHEVLSAIFAARVALAKRTLEDVQATAIAEAELEWRLTQKWVASSSTAEGSFLDFCDEFDLDPSAVRRAIKERK